jgi:hypothetical protein
MLSSCGVRGKERERGEVRIEGLRAGEWTMNNGEENGIVKCSCVLMRSKEKGGRTLKLLLGNLWASPRCVQVVTNTTSGSKADGERDLGLWLSHDERRIEYIFKVSKSRF